MVTKCDIDERFRTNLIRLRHKAGLTQHDLAMWSGVNHVGMIENGSTAAGKEAIAKLANALKTDISEFFVERHDEMEHQLLRLFRDISIEGKSLYLEIGRFLLAYEARKKFME